MSVRKKGEKLLCSTFKAYYACSNTPKSYHKRVIDRDAVYIYRSRAINSRSRLLAALE